MFKAIIVDDENLARHRLKKILKTYPDIEIISEASDGIMALEEIEKKRPDIVFLDIEMPELSGPEVGKTLGLNGPLIVFITAYDDFALQAFESCAVDYIVKPINPKRFHFCIEKIRKTLLGKKNTPLEKLFETSYYSDRPRRLAVKIGAKYKVFNPLDISVIIAKDHYSAIIVGDNEFLSDDSLERVYERLDSNIFIRVHRSAILNLNFLDELKREGDRKFMAILSDHKQSKIPISRERLVKIKTFLGLK